MGVYLKQAPDFINFLTMPTISFVVNGDTHNVDVDPQMPLLWVLRDHLQLTGTKFGCGIAQCGSCTVHLNGQPIRSCTVPVMAVEGRNVTTIEGVAKNQDHPVLRAWIEEQVPQCGYCQTGQIMNAVALLAKNPNPTEAEVSAAMTGALCRCGTYPRIKKAIAKAITLAK